MTVLKFVAVLTCLLFNQLIPAQDATISKLDSLFSHIEQNNQGMGSLSLFKDGKPYFSRAIGYAVLESDKKATTASRYKIGSISKTYTATMIMQLVDEGKLNLDQKLSDFFPKIQNSKSITIKHLLGHRTGIPEYLKEITEEDLAQPVTHETVLSRIEGNESIFTPDSKYEYSNSNYFLLGLILEEATDKSYAELLSEKILEPLELKNTYSGNGSAIDESQTYSYRKTAEWEKIPAWDMSWAYGAGEITATADEVNVFLNALMSGKLVSIESVALMKDINEGYGLGVFAVPFRLAQGYGHNGRIEDFSSNAYHFETMGMSICYISNGEVMPTNDILVGVLTIASGMTYEFPEFKEHSIIEVPEEKLKTFEGNYVSETFPLDVKVFLSDGSLLAQATGQGPFPLSAVGESEFVFVQAGIEMSFDVSTGMMKLKQAGMTNVFKRE